MDGGFHWIKCARDVTLTPRLVFTVCVALAAAAPLVARAQDSSSAPSEKRETIIGGGQPPTPTFERCVDVEIGGDKAFGCLNQKLKREVDRTNPPINLPPLDARSADVRVGNVNEAAVRQQYGSNYGRSVIPFRPQAPILALPRH